MEGSDATASDSRGNGVKERAYPLHARGYYMHTGRTGAPDLWDEDQPVSQEGYSTDLFGDRAVKVIGD
jgi:hypothetical protein